MLLAVGIGLIVFLIWVLGAFVLARSNKLKINKSFAIFIILMGLWIIANSIDNNYTKNQLSVLATRLDFFSGPLLAYSFWYFTHVFLIQITQKAKQNIFPKLLFVASLITSLLSLTNLFYTANFADHKLNAHYSKYYFFYSIILGIVALLGLVNLIIAYKKAKGIFKNQAAIMLIGLLVTVIFIVAANLLVPLITSSKTINLYTGNLAYVGLVFFIASSTYAILKHKLFDIRLAVARSVGYVFTLSAVTFVFVAPAVLLTTYLLHVHMDAISVVVFTVVAFLVAILYQNIHRVFDKFTNKIFFRDYYDAQDVLDQLGDLLVASVDLEEIETQSKKVLSNAVKPTSLEYLLVTEEGEEHELLSHLRHSATNIVVLDELDAQHHSTLYNAMNHENIAVAVRLRTTKRDLGFMVLGYKQSGAIYSDTDKRLLTIAADEIAIGLQNALRFKEIQEFNVTLENKVEEATHKLRKANERLKALDETKDDFISMSSHQLRTPLTSIKGYVSLVLDGDAGHITETQRKLLSQALSGSQRMVDLISDLLNVSRLKTGKFIIEPTPVNLANTVSEEMGRLKEIAAARNLELTFEEPKKFPTLKVDELKTRQVIMNFIDNAIYYTPSGGHIKVELKDLPEAIELKVVDDGIGVPEKEKAHLFTKFFRAPNAQKARPDGTGIGLFLARQVIEAQHGTLIFESKEGQGSTFGFRFNKKALA